MIRFGPAGIPLSCKGRTLRDGIEDVHNLGLTAMEGQLVRVSAQERSAEPEEIGATPRSISSDLIIEIVRKKGTKDQTISNPDETIRDGDTLVVLSCGLARTYEELTGLRSMADSLDVQLSIHTPYYMDIVSDGELYFKSMDSIRWASVIANELGAATVVTHVGLYGESSPKTALKKTKERLTELTKWNKKHGLKVTLGLELSGRQEVFGSLQEISKICRDIEGVMPVINFAHYHSREGGTLREPKDFDKVLDAIEELTGGEYYTHFSGVEHEDGNEKRFTSIKKGDLRFEPLAEAIVDRNQPVTIISSSPLLEHDAMYMKVILERVLAKKVSKEIKNGVPKKEKAGSR
jgi:deoxyribonuclease-4